MPETFKRHHHHSAYVVSVNMGYGHERAAFGIRELAAGGIITANAYAGIPTKDKKLWTDSRKLYELVSRLKPVPFVGDAAFSAMDRLQRIPPFYPRRDLSHPSLQVMQTYYFIEHLGLCEHLILKLSRDPKPLICTFFIPAFAAEQFDYPGDIYLTVCDADMSRAWVARDPKKSRIKYLAPNGRVVERLKLYGVKEENIYLTGFPLPPELIGGADGVQVKKDLVSRICNLDPDAVFINKYFKLLETELGAGTCMVRPSHPLTLTFAVGGAGAQRTLGVDIMAGLRGRLRKKEITLRLVAGTRPDVALDFERHAHRLNLGPALGRNLFIDHYADRKTYFMNFTRLLRKTDILWTKPSELSFYTGAGLPVVMAPPIGSQEGFNRRWLQDVGGGIDQGDPHYTGEWLFDWINSGGLARMAWNGYIEAPTHGAYRIESIITGEEFKLPMLPLIV